MKSNIYNMYTKEEIATAKKYIEAKKEEPQQEFLSRFSKEYEILEWDKINEVFLLKHKEWKEKHKEILDWKEERDAIKKILG